MSGVGLIRDVAIIGGGLAGLMAAARAEELGARGVLLDVGVPGTPGDLGGFAPVSGAKFSLYPAGSGLAPLVGGRAALVERYRSVCSYMATLGLSQFDVTDPQLVGEETSGADALSYRRYHSVLISPAEMDALLLALSGRLSRTEIVRRAVVGMDVPAGGPFQVRLAGGGLISARRVVMAAGRLGSLLLEAAGVPQGRGKGIDVGVRLDFKDLSPVAGLRESGPDAKFLADGIRTFCLNSPGRIFHHPGIGFSIPGGVVAEAGWTGSNVGVLCRHPDRDSVLAGLRRHAAARAPAPLELVGCGVDLGWTASSKAVVGVQTADRITAFVSRLSASGHVALPSRYRVHYPLLDWYWPVFSLPDRLETACAGLYAAGDASGHARGLMQAAVMGVMSAEEALI